MRASKSDAATGSQPTAWVASQSVRAPARRAAATMAVGIRHLAGRRLHERERDERGVGARPRRRGRESGAVRTRRPRPEWTNGSTIDEKSPSATSTSAPSGSGGGDERGGDRRLRADRDAVRGDADERREVRAGALDGGRVARRDPVGPAAAASRSAMIAARVARSWGARRCRRRGSRDRRRRRPAPKRRPRCARTVGMHPGCAPRDTSRLRQVSDETHAVRLCSRW